MWVSDITYLPPANGSWIYLCAFQDQCTKQVVSWHMGSIMPETLVTTALQRDLLGQAPAPGLVVYSNRGRTRQGGQHCGDVYCTLLCEHGALRSQNRRSPIR